MKNLYVSRFVPFCNKIVDLTSKNVVQYPSRVVMGLIIAFLLSGLIMANRPIHDQYYQNVMKISQQSHYPLTREMANQLLEQDEPIRLFQFYRLLRAVHEEEKRVYTQEQMEFEKKFKSDYY